MTFFQHTPKRINRGISIFPGTFFKHQFSTQFTRHFFNISFPHTSPGTYPTLVFYAVPQALFPTSVFHAVSQALFPTPVKLFVQESKRLMFQPEIFTFVHKKCLPKKKCLAARLPGCHIFCTPAWGFRILLHSPSDFGPDDYRLALNVCKNSRCWRVFKHDLQ